MSQMFAPSQPVPEGTTWSEGMPASSVTAPYAPPAAPTSGFGDALGTVGKVLSHPLTLAALKGYSNALSMPRGAGPITRTVGGLSSGLEDYFVGYPYRQTQMQKAAAETEKEQALTAEAKMKRQDLQNLSPEDRQVAEFPGLASRRAKQEVRDEKAKAAQALIPYYQSQAQGTAKGNPTMSGVYAQAAEALAAGADPKEVTAAVRLAQSGKHQEAMEGISRAHLSVSQGQLSVAQQREAREQDALAHPEKYPGSPSNKGQLVTEFDPEKGENVQRYQTRQELQGQTYQPKMDVGGLRAVRSLKAATGMLDLLEQDVAGSNRSAWKAKADKFFYDLGLKAPDNRNDLITQTGAVLQQLQSMAAASGNTRAYSALKQYQQHFPQYGDSSELIRSKIKKVRENLKIVADSLGYKGYKSDPAKENEEPQAKPQAQGPSAGAKVKFVFDAQGNLVPGE